MTDSTPHLSKRYSPYSALHTLLERAAPQPCGYNPDTRKTRYRASAEELFDLLDNADLAHDTFTVGLRGIGLLISHCKTDELNAKDWKNIADLMITLAEGVLITNDLKLLAKNGEPG